MEYLEQMLADIGIGTKLIIEVKMMSKSKRFYGYVMDGMTHVYIAADHTDLDNMIATLDYLADRWLRDGTVTP